MPLNKLENFIKNAEGRILYVNPNDLDSTDGVENQGNSLTKPFKTIQRALIESARFSYLRGEDNDIVEKTTILVFPGEHLIDNRPGYAIQDIGNNAISVAPNGAQTNAQAELTLTLNSNFDLTQENNILYKFNSVFGGIIIPRGTSIVGLDLRKTKVRPKYVPNPTDDTVKQSAIFRITGACYFWQFTFFDGDESGLVYTDPKDFSENNRSKPVFSHHKVTCFEYADGVNLVGGYQLTDLDMYYSKISNAFNRASGREIDQKFPSQGESFSKQRPEWEIVGAFGADPVKISNIISGDGATPGTIVTVTTQIAHELSAGTPVKIRGISEPDYNISTKVVQVLDETRFTYALPFVRANLPAGQPAGLSIGSNASVTIETDTVSGASPYIFNVSLRSVYGMQGMHADGSKADGFRSMVVAQFTAVSLQKDDRAFVKYNVTNRQWQGINYKTRSGDELSAESSNSNQVLHLSSDAVYREGWKTVHIKMSNDSVVQVVSVFAIGFHLHFLADSGGDASITNSNSNFGQFSLGAEGFKRDAFTKDDKGYITNIIAPRSVSDTEVEVEWVQFDVSRTKSINRANRIYLLGYVAEDVPPPIISQGYRIGSRVDDEVFLDDDTHKGKILMTNGPLDLNTNTIAGTDTSAKIYRDVTITTPVAQSPTQMVFNCTASHDLRNGESIRIFSENGDLPEGLEEESVYFAITDEKNGTRADGVSLNGIQFQVASSKTNAEAQTPIYIPVYLGSQIRVESRISDKTAGELGHPIQYDSATRSITNVETSVVTNETAGWFIHCENNSDLFQHIILLSNNDSEISYVKRKADDRSLDEKLYRMRYVVPKELDNTRDPVNGFILQDSSSINVRETSDFNLTDIGRSDYDFDRNPRFITTCTYDNGANLITIRSDKPHNLKNDDVVIISDVVSSTNGAASKDFGFNGTFNVEDIVNDKTFTVNDVDISGITHDPGNILNDTNVRDKVLPRFKRNNNNQNFYLYRTEVIKPYIQNVQDGVYYLYVLNSGNAVGSEFVNSKYSQKVTNLYPQLDRDNVDDNPTSAVSLARRNPLGEVVTNDLKRSITRETLDKFVDSFSLGNKITSVVDSGASAVIVFDDEHQLNGLNSYTTLNGGSGHTDGNYFNVRLFNNNAAPSSAMWDGATANVTVSGGAVTVATIKESGSGYTDSETLYFDSSTIGGTPSANVITTLSGISTATADYVQITGIGTVTDGYYRITDSSAKKQLTIAKTVSDPVIVSDQYAMVVGRVGIVAANGVTTPTTGIEQIATTEGHGLVVGNKVRLTDGSNGLVGDFIVNNATYNTFQVSSTTSLSATKHILKHGFSANNASADALGENLGTRGIPNYDNEVLFLGQSITTEENFITNLPTGASGVIARFPLGSYLQIGNEIMRLRSTTLIGGGNDEIQVIRGSMGTIIEPHTNGAQIKKIKLAPIELRRPSILRASGHTFEYLGYGPGNYSTGLPQVQVKTLSEKEEFLSQAQETSCGTVLYTGMDSDGDFYIGNTKYSAQSGEQTTFDVPTPTVTGEDPNRLSVVFDEVIVKERILVEGGKSKQILSQFDGPITFNGDVRMNKKLVLNNDLRVIGKVDFQNTNDATSCSDANAALRVQGGVAIGKKLFVCGDVDFGSNLQLDGTLTVNGTSKLTGEVTVDTGIVPDTDEGAYLGTAAKPFSEAHIDEIRIGVSGDTEIDTATGGLTLDSAGGTTTVDDNLVVTGNLDVDGSTQLDGLNVDGNTTLDNTTIGGTLSVSGSANFASNSVQISNSTVTASNFNGTASQSNDIRVDGLGNSSGPHYLLLQNGTTSGHYTRAKVDSGISYDSSSNTLRLLGDLIAFISDDRVKTDKAPLDDALAKVCSLSGFTYNFNEKGAELGFPTDVRNVGVSAQEIQKVLPEAVKTRDDDYITVQYEKIVPLLIEAIKELSDKVSTLEDKLNK